MTNQTTDLPFALGRHEQFDEASRNFNIRELITPSMTFRSYSWPRGPQLNQAQAPACVGFSWAEELQDKPVVIPASNDLGLAIYHEAQALDGMAMPHDGTSVLAGAKAVQNRGHLDEYRWAFNVEDLFLAIAHHGPAIIGIPWFNDMWTPDAQGLVHHTNGSLAGGHALSCRGTKAVMISSSGPVNTVTQKVLDHAHSLIRATNHWMNSPTIPWGVNGECFFTVEQLEWLLNQQGDACIPVKRR